MSERIRKRCTRVGHKFHGTEGMSLPYVFCARWFCDASAVALWAPAALAVSLHNAIPIAIRVPPVTLGPDGAEIVEDDDAST